MSQSYEWKDLPEYPGVQELVFDYGTIQIDSSNPANDRGRVKVTTSAMPPVSMATNLISLYYFDEINAKIDIYRWLKIIDVFLKDGTLEDTKEIVVISGEPWVIHGKTCILSLLPIRVKEVKFFASGGD